MTQTSSSLEQELFLQRLHRLQALHRYCHSDLPAADVTLIGRSIVSTYLDCRALGVCIEASNILHAS